MICLGILLGYIIKSEIWNDEMLEKPQKNALDLFARQYCVHETVDSLAHKRTEPKRTDYAYFEIGWKMYSSIQLPQLN